MDEEYKIENVKNAQFIVDHRRKNYIDAEVPHDRILVLLSFLDGSKSVR